MHSHYPSIGSRNSALARVTGELLTVAWRREQAHMAVFKNWNQNHAGDEAADVRAPGDAALADIGKRRAD